MNSLIPADPILVTGATGGLGASLVQLLRQRGVRVVTTDLYGEVDYLCDLTDRLAVDAMVARVEADLGPLSGLAQVAGALAVGSLLDSDFQDLERLLSVNTLATAYILSAVGRRMRERRQGAIVVVASNTARVARTRLGAYGASKAAVASLAKSVALELAEHGVRCNVVHPGSTETAMLRASWGDNPAGDVWGVAKESAARAATLAGDLAQHRLGIPLGRIAEPVDVAECLAFLLSPAARHITLAELVVDGGATL